MADVQLELQLAQMWKNLVGVGSLATQVAPTSFAALKRDVLTMLSHAEREGVPSDHVVWARGAVVAANAAHDQRNRMAHDMFLPHVDADGVSDPLTLRRVKIHASSEGVPVSEADLLAVVTQITRAHLRLWAINWEAMNWTGPFKYAQRMQPPFDVWAVARDEFVLNADGGFRETPGVPGVTYTE